MEEIDLYSDLPVFDFSSQIKELQDEIKSQKSLVEILERDLQKFKRTTEVLERNISELFRTAKNELERKDRMISDLRRELDDFKFRRQTKQFKRERDSPCSIQSEPAAKKPKQEPKPVHRESEIESYPKSDRSMSREPGEIVENNRNWNRDRNYDRSRRRSPERRDRYRNSYPSRGRSRDQFKNRDHREKHDYRKIERPVENRDDDSNLQHIRNNIVHELKSLDRDSNKHEPHFIEDRSMKYEENSELTTRDSQNCVQNIEFNIKIKKESTENVQATFLGVGTEPLKTDRGPNGLKVRKPKSKIEEVTKKLFTKAGERRGNDIIVETSTKEAEIVGKLDGKNENYAEPVNKIQPQEVTTISEKDEKEVIRVNTSKLSSYKIPFKTEDKKKPITTKMNVNEKKTKSSDKKEQSKSQDSIKSDESNQKDKQSESKRGFLVSERNNDIQQLMDMEKNNLDKKCEKKQLTITKRNSRSDDSSTVSNDSFDKSKSPVTTEPSGRILRSATRKSTKESPDKSRNKIIILENKLITGPNNDASVDSVSLSHDGEIPVLHIDDNDSSIQQPSLFNLADFPITTMEKQMALDATSKNPPPKSTHDILREDLSLSSCELSDSSVPKTPEKRIKILKRRKCVSFTMID